MDARLFSEVEPTNINTGRIWIKPSTATAYMKLGSTWVVLGSAGDSREFRSITVYINGIDVTSLIGKDSLSIDDILTKEVDSCTFILFDPDGTHKPQVGQEVLIWYKETEASTAVLRFAGLIDDAPQEQTGIGRYHYEVTCTDYTQELNKNLVVETYNVAEQTVGDIVRDIVNTYAVGLGTYFVDDGPVVNYIAFNYKYPMECLEELAQLTGYDWYVDYERQIHFFSTLTAIEAPYELTESAGSGEYQELAVSVDKTSLRNASIVRGGYEFSSLYTQEEVADGVQESFTCRYQPFSPITVYVNDGGGYDVQTLGIDNVDKTGKMFVVNVAEKVVKSLDYGILTAGYKIKITYTYKKPILASVMDTASINLMKEYEGGDGIHWAPLIVDTSIETKAQARARAQAELDQYSNPLVKGTFKTTQYGYRSGQILTINIPSREILDKQYLIQQVTASSLGMGDFEYEVTFASQLKGLTDYLIQLHKDSRKVSERTDVVLDILKTMLDESIIVADANLAKTLRVTIDNPYDWCNDAGTTPDKGRYGLSTWW